MNEIYYCCPTQDRAHYLKRNFERVLPYVDKAIIIDGGSKDNTKELCESLSPKVEFYSVPWTDQFDVSWNAFLEYVPVGAWVLVQDDDEYPSLELCENLRHIVDESDNGRNYSVVEFRCHPISLKSDGKEIDLGISNYYRQIFYLRGPETRYQGKLHQYVVGYIEPEPDKSMVLRSNLEYIHAKTENDELLSSARNWFIGGIFFSWCKGEGIFGPEHVELHELLSIHHPEVKVFSDLVEHIKQGNIHSNILKWINYYSKKYETGCPGRCYLCEYVPFEERGSHDYFNELRAFRRWIYERAHPEWKPLAVSLNLPFMLTL